MIVASTLDGSKENLLYVETTENNTIAEYITKV
jgi:hypothetical protein